MTIDNLTDEQKTNLDYLKHFYAHKIPVHIKLLRTNNEGVNIFLNGKIIDFYNTIILLDENVLGETRVSLFEIKPNGVMEERK